MKEYYILIMSFCTIMAYGMENGTYVTNKGWILSVNDDEMYIKTAQNDYYQVGPDTIASCRYEYVSSNVVQVFPLLSVSQIQKSTHVVAGYDPRHKNSIQIRLNLPESCSYFVSLIFDGPKKGIEHFVWNKASTSYTCFKKDVYSLEYIEIWPMIHSDLFLIDGCSLCPLKLSLWDARILFDEVDDNVFTINVPELTQDYFLQYQIVGEYMMIEGDTIKWRGMDFVRQ